MVYDIPADPEWDLQALLAKVSDLCKEAVAGGIFLGDIGDLVLMYGGRPWKVDRGQYGL